MPKLPGYSFVEYNIIPAEHKHLDTQEFFIEKIVPLFEDSESLTVSVELTNSLNYSPAFNLSLYPSNSDEIIDHICSVQHYDPAQTFSIQNKFFNEGISTYQALKNFCDLTSLIRKPILKNLSFYCTSKEKKAQLEVLTSLKGKEEYRQKIEEKFLSIPEILEIFEIKVPIGDLVQILDRIKPRYFTVCSAYGVHGNIQIACQINKKGRYVGLFARFLEGLYRKNINCSVYGNVKPSAFTLVENVPLLMIGNGCGVAPFRSLLFEMKKNPLLYKNTILMFGFRTIEHFYYRNDFESLMKNDSVNVLPYEHKANSFNQETNVIDHVFVGYSRSGPKVYVQDIVKHYKEIVWNVLKDGVVYICGGTSMGKSVSEALKQITIENSDENLWKSIQPKIKTEIWG